MNIMHAQRLFNTKFPMIWNLLHIYTGDQRDEFFYFLKFLEIKSFCLENPLAWIHKSVYIKHIQSFQMLFFECMQKLEIDLWLSLSQGLHILHYIYIWVFFGHCAFPFYLKLLKNIDDNFKITELWQKSRLESKSKFEKSSFFI